MTIAEVREKLKLRLIGMPKDVLLIVILLLACFASFGLGFLAGRDAAGQGSAVTLAPSPLVAAATGEVIAAKGGTKYYFPWCAGADRISAVNKVSFASASAAASAGYTLASNCKGQ